MFSTPFTFLKASGGGPTPPVEQLFTSSGTWSCCTGAVCIEVIAVGGGGGGNGGGKCNVGANRGNAGGQGGGGGGFVIATLTGAQVPSSICVTVGNGGSGAPVTDTNGYGCNGTDGGNSSFGSCLIACGGKAGNNGSGTSRLGGYTNSSFGGINGCAGLGGGASITTGTGTATAGNCGGDMFMSCYTPQSCLNGRDGNANLLSPRGGGAGGAVAKDSSTSYCGLGGFGYGAFTCCGLTIGGAGQGGNALDSAGTNATSYGGGGGGSAATLTGNSAAAGSGCPGVVKVIQYF